MSSILKQTLLLLNNIFRCKNQDKIYSEINKFDLARYQGKWYEIARFKNPFQNKCLKNVTAEYQLLDNGMIKVVNQSERKNGKMNTAEGLARIQDKKDSSKLEVSFFDILGWRPVWGDYWILYVDPEYSLSVVGDRKSQYGWVLSRNSVLTQSELKKAKFFLDKNGYDSKELLITLHDTYIKKKEESI
jgi:apolipoprotein D and lipocalin family protein